MSKIVLDASAVLALLNAEPGGERVEAELGRALISTVNYSEVVAKLADAGMPEQPIREALDWLNLEIVPFEAEHALRAGLLRPPTRALGLSFGDRACLALGLCRGLPVWTTDSEWRKLTLDIDVVLIR